MTKSAASTVPTYEKRFMPRLFDIAITVMFAPFGGARRLRERALDLAGIGGGTRVLELGCGTGGVTALMLSRGARVEAIDGSAQMLEQARRAAPGASFTQMQLEDLAIDEDHDVVLLAFVLHELTPELRAEVLAKALVALASDGRLAILDHAVPRSGLRARAWRWLLLALEPPTVRDCIERGYAAEVERAGGRVTATHNLAGGTAALTLGSPDAVRPQ